MWNVCAKDNISIKKNYFINGKFEVKISNFSLFPAATNTMYLQFYQEFVTFNIILEMNTDR
ncbi:MAG: hypothetical protein A2161_12730 [Candidatus Schekmanbacteria bacterium RBG_13_48_7]|uniref:Uncharacterized protein n=1 Tax=Candidatus Schekmanbacteria bacterium RBG_13_48_7 TaxID=1817878 RepID=A0A1F7S2R9_9BACT|nr:MAG: hypothetical protein A2161_12730 [Candidatus Schekmanbacteria bacterium RBG_13_48_7]